jgi:hypothetical protein
MPSALTELSNTVGCAVRGTLSFATNSSLTSPGAFNSHIIHHLSEQAAEIDLQLHRHSGYSELFKARGRTITAKRVLSLRSRRQHDVTDFIRAIVSHVLNQEWLEDLLYKRHRVHYTHKICKAFMALDTTLLREFLTRRRNVDNAATHLGSLAAVIPAIAATLDDSKMMLRHIVSHA